MRIGNGGGTSPARPGSGTDGRAVILHAAAEAFMEMGYDRASIDEIADRLDATKGRVYHYYRSKVDILLDIHVEMLAVMIDEIESIATGDGPVMDRLEKMARTHAQLMMDNLAFARVTLISSIRLNLARTDKQRAMVKSIRNARAMYESHFLRLIQEAADEGILRELDPPVATKAFLGTLNWVGMWFQPPQSDDSGKRGSADIADELAAFAVSGLVPGY